MKGIYLAAFKANHPGFDIVYQDINGKRDLGGDMLDIDFVKCLKILVYSLIHVLFISLVVIPIGLI